MEQTHDFSALSSDCANIIGDIRSLFRVEMTRQHEPSTVREWLLLLLFVENRAVPHGGQGAVEWQTANRSRRTTTEEIKIEDKQEATEHFNKSLLLVFLNFFKTTVLLSTTRCTWRG